MSALPLAMTRAQVTERMRDLGILLPLVVWLVYTRLYWVLHAAHLSAPPCPFYYLTGHPGPFCGGTRALAYTWSGDIPDAVRLYPLGPVVVRGTFVGIGGFGGGVAAGGKGAPPLGPRPLGLGSFG